MRLATRAALSRYGGRHHSGIPRGIIPFYPGGFVVIGTLLRKAARRTVEGLWTAIGELLDDFTPTQCANFFVNAGYDPD